MDSRIQIGLVFLIAAATYLRDAFRNPELLTEDALFNLVYRKDLLDAIRDWEEETSFKALQLMRDGLKKPNSRTPKIYTLRRQSSSARNVNGFSFIPEVSTHPCAFEEDELKRYFAMNTTTSWNVNRKNHHPKTGSPSRRST